MYDPIREFGDRLRDQEVNADASQYQEYHHRCEDDRFQTLQAKQFNLLT